MPSTTCDDADLSVNVSVRLDDGLAERLRLRTRAAVESLSDRLRRYAEEGARRNEHPLITFRDAPTGQRAGLVGAPYAVVSKSLIMRTETAGSSWELRVEQLHGAWSDDRRGHCLRGGSWPG